MIRRTDQGGTLIEVVVTLGIVSAVSTAAVALLAASVRTATVAEQQTTAALIAMRIVEEWRVLGDRGPEGVEYFNRHAAPTTEPGLFVARWTAVPDPALPVLRRLHVEVRAPRLATPFVVDAVAPDEAQ